MSTDDDDSLLQHRRLLLSASKPQRISSSTLLSLDDEVAEDDDDDDDDTNSHSSSLSSSKVPDDDDDPLPPYSPEGEVKASQPQVDCYQWLRSDLEGKGQRRRNDSSSGSSSLSTSPALPTPTPPDGGWGWMVVLGAFLVNLICDGLAYSFGVMFTELIEEFGQSRSKTSWVGSIFFGVPMILGPLASALTTRFGCRKMTIVGGIISCLGCLLSVFADSVEMLCFTFSAVVGLGFSFCYVASVIVVAFYFERHRALATGVAVCGTGCGTFTFAPLLNWLLSIYDVRGLFLILAGLCLNLVVCGMLFRPLCFTESQRLDLLRSEFSKLPEGRGSLELARSRYASESGTSVGSEDFVEEDGRTLSVLHLPTFLCGQEKHVSPNVLMEALKFSRNPDLTVQRYVKNAVMRQGTPDSPQTAVTMTRSPSVALTFSISVANSLDSPVLSSDKNEQPSSVFSDVFVQENRCNDDVSTPLTQKQLLADSPVFHPVSNPATSTTKLPTTTAAVLAPNDPSLASKVHTLLVTTPPPGVSPKICGRLIGRHQALSIHMPLYRSDIFYRTLQAKDSNLDACTLGTSCPEMLTGGQKEEGDERSWLCRSFLQLSCECRELMGNMFDARLFHKPFFNVFLLSNFLFYFWNDVPYMYASDYAQVKGFDASHAAFLISVIGIFNTAGQLVFGYIGDLKVNLLLVYIVASCLQGLVLFAVPIVHDYWTTAAAYGVFGFFVSVSFPLTTVLMVEFLGVDKLTTAYGMLMLVQGVANLAGPPIAGLIADVTSSYAPPFFLSAAFFVLQGLVLLLLFVPALRPKVMARRKRIKVAESGSLI